jgi:hypothetical protein
MKGVYSGAGRVSIIATPLFPHDALQRQNEIYQMLEIHAKT